MLSFSDLKDGAPHLGWSSVQAVDPSRLQLVASPTRNGRKALQVTVKPGDNPIHSTGERNEFCGMFGTTGNDENGDSGTQYYGISILQDSDWKDTAMWCAAFQLHGVDTNPQRAGSPVFELDLSSTPGRFTLVQRGGDIAGQILRVDTDLGPHNYGKWVDFLFQVRWAADASGYTAVWRRDSAHDPLALIKAWHTPTLYSANGVAQRHYWKSGCYSDAVPFQRKFCRGVVSRADTMEEAAMAAFN
jgi:hypothetical protein